MDAGVGDLWRHQKELEEIQRAASGVVSVEKDILRIESAQEKTSPRWGHLVLMLSSCYGGSVFHVAAKADPEKNAKAEKESLIYKNHGIVAFLASSREKESTVGGGHVAHLGVFQNLVCDRNRNVGEMVQKFLQECSHENYGDEGQHCVVVPFKTGREKAHGNAEQGKKHRTEKQNNKLVFNPKVRAGVGLTTLDNIFCIPEDGSSYAESCQTVKSAIERFEHLDSE